MLLGMTSGRPLMVFLSHTSELWLYPKDDSFFEAAEAAVRQAGCMSVHMPFSPQDRPPVDVSLDAVRSCDIFVLVAGHSCGSFVDGLDEPKTYVELEFETASDAGLERLVFLLHDKVPVPHDLIANDTDRERQQEFRGTLRSSDLTVVTVNTPNELTNKLLQALHTKEVFRRLGGATNLRPRLRTFRGRTDQLQQLDQDDSDAEAPIIHVLTGMPGVGKTATALQYAHAHAHELDIVWWIDAGDSAHLREQLVQLARMICPANRQEAGDDVDRLFTELRSRSNWLLVFDDVESPEVLSDCLPSRGPGHVLITSRDTSWHQVGVLVGVGVFTTEDSVAMLCSGLPGLSEEAAARVAAALGNLPLALDQAIVLLAATHHDVETYLELLSAGADRLHSHDGGGVYGRSLAATFGEALRRLARDHPTALQLLTLAAYAAPQPLRLNIIRRDPDSFRPLRHLTKEPILLDLCAQALTRRCLAQRHADVLVVHPVLAALMREWTSVSTHAAASVWPGQRIIPSEAWSEMADVLRRQGALFMVGREIIVLWDKLTAAEPSVTASANRLPVIRREGAVGVRIAGEAESGMAFGAELVVASGAESAMVRELRPWWARFMEPPAREPLELLELRELLELLALKADLDDAFRGDVPTNVHPDDLNVYNVTLDLVGRDRSRELGELVARAPGLPVSAGPASRLDDAHDWRWTLRAFVGDVRKRALYLHEVGEHEEAVVLVQRTFAQATAPGGARHEVTQEIVDGLAVVLEAIQEPERADALRRHAVDGGDAP